ncbi:MAG: DUF4760 domain-containing protein [Acidimicrobiales bacterium]
MAATHEDARLVVDIARWGTEMGVDKSYRELFSNKFDPAAASVDDEAVHKVLNFGETIGTLVKQGVLDRGLVLDIWWVRGLWDRVQQAAKRERDRVGEQRLYENFEALAGSAT